MTLLNPGPKTLAALGVCLCFLIVCFLCGFQSGCDDVDPCHFWAPEPGVYRFIYTSPGTTSFGTPISTAVTQVSEGGPTNVGPTRRSQVSDSMPICGKLVSFRKIS